MFKDIIERFLKMDMYEKRSATDTYCELVFYNKDMGKWNIIFTGVFGQPVKPEGADPNKVDLALTKSYGGIFNNQILFKKDFDNFTTILMLWPWQDGAHTTLKMAAMEK